VTLRIARQPPPKNKIKPSEPCGQKAAFVQEACSSTSFAAIDTRSIFR